MRRATAELIVKDPNKFAHHDRVFLNNPVVMQGMGLAPLVVLATSGQNAVMLAAAVALLLVPSRVLACLLSRLVPLHDEDPAPETLQKKLLPRALVYGFSTAVVYLAVYPILNILFSTSLLSLGIYLPLLTALRELGPDADGRMPQGAPVPAITRRIRRMHENMQRTRLALEESHENLRQNLRQTEKMALVGKLAAGVAHSIRNPLTGLKLRLFSFTRGMELSPARQEDVQAMNEAVRHMEAITSNFLEFSRRPRLSKEPLDMSEVLDRTLILLQPRMEAYKVTLRRTRHAPLPRVDGDAEQLREALANLIINACEAAGTDGEVRISEERGRLAPLGPVVVIRIEDSGPGVPEELHEVIFQPFMSTKVEGTGLGLPIARRIFEEHGGWLHLHNAPGHGASFVMVLPVRKGDDVWLRSS